MSRKIFLCLVLMLLFAVPAVAQVMGEIESGLMIDGSSCPREADEAIEGVPEAAYSYTHLMSLFPPPSGCYPPIGHIFFYTGNPVMKWDHISGLAAGQVVRSVWTAPNGDTYPDMDPFTVPYSGTWCIYIWWSVGFPDIPDIKGRWSVSAFVDDQLVSTDYFYLNDYPHIKVSINIAEGGKVIGPGINCGGGGKDCSENFYHNETVDITAIPKYGWSFSHWQIGETTSAVNPLPVTVDNVFNIKAVFKFNPVKGGWRWLLTIDGMEVGASYYPTWPDMPSVYLYEAMDLEWRTKIRNVLGPITPFTWSRDLYTTNATVLKLYERIKYLNSTGRPVVVLAHSWGTVLVYITLMKYTDIKIEKLISLGSPLDLTILRSPQIYAVTKWRLKQAGVATSISMPTNLGVWHNYWTGCDPVSNYIGALPASNNIKNAKQYKTLNIVDPFKCHASYFEDSVEWDKILSDVITR